MFSNIGFAPTHPPTPDPSSDLQSTLIENFFHTACLAFDRAASEAEAVYKASWDRLIQLKTGGINE